MNSTILKKDHVTFKMVYCEGGDVISYGNQTTRDSRTFKRKSDIKPFWMAETLVTSQLFFSVMGALPEKSLYYIKNRKIFRLPSSTPVTNLSWVEATLFCDRLSEHFKLEKFYESKYNKNKIETSFRLPTIWEWEWAAKASRHVLYAGDEVLNDLAWHKENSEMHKHPVKEKMPNALGLYDMSGNVAEWCEDRESFDNILYKAHRGGDYSKDARMLRLGWGIPDKLDRPRQGDLQYADMFDKYDTIGFRFVCSELSGIGVDNT